MARVLIIDDNDTLREGAAAVVRKMGHDVVTASSGLDGVRQYKRVSPDVVFTDFKMDGDDGIAVLDKIKQHDPDAVVVIMTGYGTVKTAVEAMKKGALDFIEKPFSPDVLRQKVNTGIELRNERKRAERSEALAKVHEQAATARFIDEKPASDNANVPERKVKGLVGNSEAMQQVFQVIAKVARTDVTVFIHGESGTGKELVARAIHEISPRKDQPFIGVNCAAIPSTLLEAELFGYERGAFTGAVKRKLGRFELAQGGTLFLDEIGDLPLEMQAKILRVLQEKTVERIGGEAPVPVDVRIVSATHRDIKAMVSQGTFREDLLYRLHIVPVTLPPLRERPGDINILAQHFVQKLAPRTNPRVAGLDEGALTALSNYRWPGNVRELENAIEQSLVFAEGNLITADDLPAMLGALKTVKLPPVTTTPEPSLALPAADDPRTLDEILEGLERALILRAYELSGGVKTETARRLGIKTSALYYKLAKYQIGIDGVGTSDETNKSADHNATSAVAAPVESMTSSS